MAAGTEYAAPGFELLVACYFAVSVVSVCVCVCVYVREYASMRLNVPVCIHVFWVVYGTGLSSHFLTPH